MLTIRTACREEAELLTLMSRRAFDSDAEVGAAGAGGPPCYDDVSWHQQMAEAGHLYAALADGAIVGGALLFRDEDASDRLYVARIFLDPAYFRHGYGLAMMQGIEAMFPDVRVFHLDTPAWNSRTNRFYNKAGYAEVKRDADFVYYEKRRTC